MKNTRNFRTIFLIISSAVLPFFGAAAYADELDFGKLPYEKCIDTSLQDDFAQENQRFWFPRNLPYIGYTDGEQTPAGGDGSCYLGFPNAHKESALVFVDDAMVEVFPMTHSQQNVSQYRSGDRSIIVEIRITGQDTSCGSDVETCCGEYTYATITVKKNGKTKSVTAANYNGG
ncbi:MAG: hypothetical protein Q4G42_08770 [Neisseria sp.]|nr:hypothetical protein [Neisseria sp.]